MEDLILDFNLYLCEKFGYRNSCSVMQNANGFCVNISERDLDCYIRFWEYSCGRGNFPDWSIIIVRSNFKKNQEESLKDLARFFKEYMPRYGYKYLCTEGDNYKYYQTLGLKLIYRGFFDQNNYGLPGQTHYIFYYILVCNFLTILLVINILSFANVDYFPYLYKIY